MNHPISTTEWVIFWLAVSIVVILLTLRAAVAVWEWWHVRNCPAPDCRVLRAQIARANAYLDRWAD